jgi:hypothetical protein
MRNDIELRPPAESLTDHTGFHENFTVFRILAPGMDCNRMVVRIGFTNELCHALDPIVIGRLVTIPPGGITFILLCDCPQEHSTVGRQA